MGKKTTKKQPIQWMSLFVIEYSANVKYFFKPSYNSEDTKSHINSTLMIV